MSFPRATAFVLAFSTLVACGPRDDKYNPSHFAVVGPVAPADIVLPTGLKRGQTFGGIHPSWNPDDTCCTADPVLSIPVSKVGAATVLRLSGYFGRLDGSSHLVVTFPDGTKHSARIVASGFTSARLAIPASLRDKTGIVRIGIAAPGPFVLTSVYFE